MRNFGLFLLLTILWLSQGALAQMSCSEYKVMGSVKKDLKCGASRPLSPVEIRGIQDSHDRIADQRSSLTRDGLITNWLNDTIFYEQEQMHEAIFDSLGDLALDFNILKMQMEIDENVDLGVKTPIVFNPTRRVFLNNQGSVDFDGKSTEPLSSTYTVVSGLTMRFQPRVNLDVGDINLGFRSGEMGISLKLVKQESAPSSIEPLRSPDPVDEITTFISIENDNDIEKNRLHKLVDWVSLRVALPFKWLSNTMRDQVFDRFADNDSSRTFLNDLFSPLSETVGFTQVTVDKVYNAEGEVYLTQPTEDDANALEIKTNAINDDSLLKPGDVISVAYYRILGSDFVASLMPFQTRRADQINVLIHKSVLKKDSGIVVFRYQESAREGKTTGVGLNFRVGLGPLSFSFRPFWREIQKYQDSSVGLSSEIVYTIDLKRESGRRAFDTLFSGITPDWDSPVIAQALHEGTMVADLAGNRTIIGNGDVNRNYSRDWNLVWLWQNSREELQLQEKRTLYSTIGISSFDDVNDDLPIVGTQLTGISQQEKRNHRRFFKSENEQTSKGFRLTMELQENGLNNNTIMNINSTFRDNKTSHQEYRYYMEYIRQATMQGFLFPDNMRRVFDEVTSRTLPEGKSKQYSHLNLQLSARLTDEIFHREETHLLAVLSDMYMIERGSWTNRSAFINWARDHWEDKCSTPKISISTNESVNESFIEVNCRDIYYDAEAFLNLHGQLKSKSSEERLVLFNTFVREKGFALSKIIYLMLRLALYRTTPEQALSDGSLKYHLAFEGDDLDYIQFAQGRLFSFDPNQFGPEDPLPSLYHPTPNRVENASLYFGRNQEGEKNVTLIFDTDFYAPEGVVVKAILYRYKNILADSFEAFTLTEPTVGYGFSDVATRRTTFRYGIELPREIITELNDEKDHTIQFWVEDLEGTRITETTELKFSKPNL